MPTGKSSGRWKKSERDAARLFGTERLANSGFGQPDFVVPPTTTRPQIAVQVKTKAKIPAWFGDAMDQAVLDATNLPDEAIPAVVIVHAPGQGIKKQRYAVVRLEDAAKMIGAVNARKESSA